MSKSIFNPFLLIFYFYLASIPLNNTHAEEVKFKPYQQLKIGHLDWAFDGDTGHDSVRVGTRHIKGERIDNLVFRTLTGGKLKQDKEGNKKFNFILVVYEKDFPDVLNDKKYHLPLGVKPAYRMETKAYYEVKKGDVIMLPHGYLYRVIKFEEKLVDADNSEKPGDKPYWGVVLELLKDDDPLYGRQKMNRKNVYIPFERGGMFLGYRLTFRMINAKHPLTLKFGYFKFKIQCPYTGYDTVRGLSIGGGTYEKDIGKGSHILLLDVLFKAVDIVLPDPKTNRGGWVEIDPHPIPALSNIPRPFHVRDAPVDSNK